MSKKLIILGASGHGKVAADIAMRNAYDEILFPDDNPEITECLGCPVVGRISDAEAYQGDFFVAIGNAVLRETLQNRLEGAGKTVVSLIHPAAVIGHGVTIGGGTVVMAGTVINPCAVIGKGCIINTCASVDHDCVTVIKNNVTIAPDCMIGAGAVVVKDIEELGTYVGVPAKKIDYPVAACPNRG